MNEQRQLKTTEDLAQALHAAVFRMVSEKTPWQCLSPKRRQEYRDTAVRLISEGA